MNTIKKIITHPGIFHADDVCAVAWLRMLDINAPLQRRVPSEEELQDPAVLVVDIGGQHDPKLSNFDHHQKGGAGERWDTGIPYAGFGLVYDHYQPVDPKVAQRFHDRVVVAVDAADTGWGTATGTRPTLSFSACISGFNPPEGLNPTDRDDAFEVAVEFAQQVLENELLAAAEFVAAKQAVLTAETADSGRVLMLDKFVPWGEHVFSRPDQEHLLYVVFPSERGGWMVQQVPEEPGSFTGRLSLPEEWAGLRGEELANLVGLSTHGDATFCHPGRFCGGAETRLDALMLAQLANVWK